MKNTTNTKKGTDGQTLRRQTRVAIAEALGHSESNLSYETIYRNSFRGIFFTPS